MLVKVLLQQRGQRRWPLSLTWLPVILWQGWETLGEAREQGELTTDGDEDVD
jgi:hypothetical protein